MGLSRRDWAAQLFRTCQMDRCREVLVELVGGKSWSFVKVGLREQTI